MSPSLVCHPQTNDQVKSSNKNILESLKKCLDDVKGLWVEELPSTLWAIRTTAHLGTRDTPFNLAFRSDAIILVKIGINSLRVSHFDAEQNDANLRANLNLLEKNKRRGQLKNCCKAKKSSRVLQQTSQG